MPEAPPQDVDPQRSAIRSDPNRTGTRRGHADEEGEIDLPLVQASLEREEQQEEEQQEQEEEEELGVPRLRDRTGSRSSILADEALLLQQGLPAAVEYDDRAYDEYDESERRDRDRDRAGEQGQQGDEVASYEYPGASLYYEAATMASLNPRALAAINRFRSYKPPPFALWDQLPVRKRAAVLVLLFADRWGDLRVVVTMRAATLRNFSGHAALPGGKADSEHETPYQIARREAFEEIGLPMDDSRIPKPFRIEQLCCLPPAMARTHVIVTPCVAFLHADRTRRNEAGSNHNDHDHGNASFADGDAGADRAPLVEDSMIPRLDAREVAAVFSAPFYNFLKKDDLPARPGETHPPGPWYEGEWISWEGVRWRTHNFYVPVNNQRVSKPRRASAVSQLEGAGEDQQKVVKKKEEEDGVEKKEEDQLDAGRFRVWGMTGRVLLDAARIAYEEEPEVEHSEGLGDGEIINRAAARGVFDEAGEPKVAKI